MDIADWKLKTRLLVVHRKGNKWQQVPVSREGFKPLHTYLNSHRAVLAGDCVARKDDSVFLADNGLPLTMWGVAALFKKLERDLDRGTRTRAEVAGELRARPVPHEDVAEHVVPVH